MKNTRKSRGLQSEIQRRNKQATISIAVDRSVLNEALPKVEQIARKNGLVPLKMLSDPDLTEARRAEYAQMFEDAHPITAQAVEMAMKMEEPQILLTNAGIVVGDTILVSEGLLETMPVSDEALQFADEVAELFNEVTAAEKSGQPVSEERKAALRAGMAKLGEMT